MRTLFTSLLTVTLLITFSLFSFAEVNKEMYITKRSPVSKDSVLIADYILNGKLFVSNKFPPYQPNKPINWKEDPFKNETWRLYYQSLDSISYLMNAYETTKDPKYLSFGLNLIKSFWKVNSNPAKATDTYTYNPHTIANRTNNIMYFYHYFVDSPMASANDKKFLLDLLRTHGNLLNNSKYYNAKTNQGIIQDLTLLQLASYFPNEKACNQWKKNAVYRTKQHIKKDFTPEGLHKEHSPQYFLFVIGLIDEMNRIANDKELTMFILKEQNIFAKLVLSDYTIPRLGDTDYTKLPKTSDFSVLDPEFEYVVTRGQHGKQPALISNLSNNVVVIRDAWGSKSTSLLFTASNFSTVHKHADDLSFILNQNGKEIFIDSGKYNYNTKDSFQQYLRSTFAHNVVTVDGKSYSISSSNIGKTKITNMIDSPDNVMITGEHTIYKGVRVYRTMVYLKDKKAILIQDEILSNDQHRTNQVFNIAQNVTSSTIDSSTVLLNNSITLKQHKQASLKEYFGQKSPIRGFASTNFNSIYPIKQLDFSSAGNNIQYFTSISTTPITVKDFSLIEDQYNVVMSDGSTYTLNKPMTTPFVNEITNLTFNVEGFTQGSATIKIMSGSNVIGSGQADKDGKFSIFMPLQDAGTKLTIVSTSKSGQYKASTTIVVKDGTGIIPIDPNDPLN